MHRWMPRRLSTRAGDVKRLSISGHLFFSLLVYVQQVEIAVNTFTTSTPLIIESGACLNGKMDCFGMCLGYIQNEK